MIERIARRIPGYDCERGPCPVEGCPGFGAKGRPGGGHGIHGEGWLYVVVAKDRRVAVSLEVYTNIMPATVPAMVWACVHCGQPSQRHVYEEATHPPPVFCGCRDNAPRYGALMVAHTAFASSTDELIAGSQYCQWMDGGACWGNHSWSLNARELFAAHGDPRQFAQPEPLWAALEAALADAIERYTPAAIESAVCPTCNGKGCVP